jgi:SPP1 gp7 family putative phage head morphogenesis protein
MVKLAGGDEWDSIFEDFAKHAYDENGSVHLPTYFKTASSLADAITKGIGSGYDFDDPANTLASSLRSNLFQFSGAKNLFEQKMMASLITDENGDKIPFKDFLNKVKAINEDYNKRFLQAEYDNAVAGATMALKWKNFESINSAWLKYSTAGDDRVRDAHRLLDGMILPIDSPVWNRIYPPNDWGCRCNVVPAEMPKNPISESEAGKLGKQAVTKPIFETNVGKTELIYTDGHPYFKSIKGTHELDAEKNYGMQSISSIMKKSEDFSTPVQIDDYGKWWDDMVKKHGTGKTDFVLTDSIGNKVLFDASPDGKNKQNFFKDHITRKKDGRETLAANIPDVFNNPDVQWTKGLKQKQEIQYIKYYNDGAYLLTVVRDGEKLKAQTFYKIDKAKYADGEIRKKRTGVLLVKK